MNIDTGELRHLADVEDEARMVEVRGSEGDIADLSARVRSSADPDLDFAAAREAAMDEIRSINREERGRRR